MTPVRTDTGASAPADTDADASAAVRRREATRRVMGTDARVIVVDGPRDAAERALDTLAALEARWSRFRPDSELARAADAAGSWLTVAPETIALLEAARAAWWTTDGRCDVTGGRAIAAAGYDVDLALLGDRTAVPAPVRAFPGPTAIELDLAGGRVRLARGCVVDVGAVAKGFAADLVADRLIAEGAAGALVDVGGDVAVRGTPGRPGPWGLDLELDVDEGLLARTAPGRTWRWAVADGGVATSSSVRRTWTTTAGPAHHVLDPRTGAVIDGAPRTVSVLAASAFAAEVAATALMVALPEERPALAARLEVTAVVVGPSGSIVEVGPTAGRLW